MARKWYLLLHRMDSLVNYSKSSIFKLLSCFLLGIFLTWGISPVLSQANNPVQLVRQGREYYEAGQFQQALLSLQQASNAFSATEEKLNLSIALSNLSLVHQQLGEWQQAEQAILQSINLLGLNTKTIQTGQIPNLSSQELKILAPVLNIYGHLTYQKSQPEIALSSWRSATKIYQQLQEPEGAIATQINQVQALEALGLDRQAKITIEQIQQTITSASVPLQAQGWRSLGDILRTVGELDNSLLSLQKSLDIAQKLQSPQYIGTAWLSLGNTLRAWGNLELDRANIFRQYNLISWRCPNLSLPDSTKKYYQQADTAYQRAIATLSSPTMKVKAQINHLSLLVETGQINTAEEFWQQIDFSNLPKSRTQIYAEINLARTLACLEQKSNSNNNVLLQQAIDKLLAQGVQDAQNISDPLAESYALGNQGGFYEYLAWRNNQNPSMLETAQKLTETALLIAQPAQAPNIAYQWQWQLGRLLAVRGNKEKAISTYQAAVKTLDSVRNDLLVINSDVQFSFRDNVEPVYRQLVDLLLKTQGTNEISQTSLNSVIALTDSLQLAELENFLRCNLSSLTQDNRGVSLDREAFIYPIILDDKLDVIFKLPGQPLKHYINDVPRNSVLKTVQELRQAILRRNPERFREKSQQVYQWLIQPLEEDLGKVPNIETLVFVLDTDLRNIPMGVLYDSRTQEYLIEKKYALALLPNSQLFDLRPSSRKLKVLAAGITEALQVENRSFGAINVTDELAEIRNFVPSETLLNSQFTKANIQQQIDSGEFSIVHLATHGNFSSDPAQTYILTYDRLLRPNDLNDILNFAKPDESKKLELLVLSACETASGDNRATLGLAGLTVRSGTSSTLATLWKVSDKFTTMLMEKFYQELANGTNKAEALHRAQKSILYQQIGQQRYQNEPYDWGPYILVGNWD